MICVWAHVSLSHGHLIPVEVAYFKRRPIIAATLNGTPAYFLLDTGAALSILNSREAKRLNFGLSSADHVPGIYGLNGETTPVLNVYRSRLAISTWQLPHQWAAADLSELSRLIRHRTRYRISGIIGSDLMGRYGFVIDYRTHQVWLTNPSGKRP